MIDLYIQQLYLLFFPLDKKFDNKRGCVMSNSLFW